MKTTDFTKSITSTQLNENMFKKFGTKINFDRYTREDLENYRNLLRTKIHQAESSSSFNELLTQETYQKDQFMISLLNTKIKEMLGESKVIAEKAPPTAKGERMVKHIKKGYAKDGKLTDKEKSIAYATAWKSHNKNKADESVAEETTMKITRTLEAKKAKKDYDGDGKIESNKDEVWGSRAKAAAKAGKPFKEAEEKRAPAKTKERDVTLPSGAKVKSRTVQGWQSQKADKEAKKDSGLEEASKPDFLDLDKDGNKKEPMKKAAKEKRIKESTLIFRNHVKIVNEGLRQLLREDEEGKAKAITAASDMVNDFTTWMQRVGQYQTKSMIELADSIRGEFGQAEAEAFKNAVAPALTATLETMTQQREAISHAVAVLAGEATDVQPMGMDASMGDMGPSSPDDLGSEEIPDTDDGFSAAGAASGGAETAGREKRVQESKLKFKRKIQESHDLMRSLSR